MDLASHMLLEQIYTRHAHRFEARRVCPPYRRHFSFLPIGARSGFVRNADRLLNRLRAYPKYLRTIAGDADLFHVCDHSYAQLVHALPAACTGVFCHDLDTFRCLIEPAAEPRPRWFKKMARHILGGLQKAAVVFYTTEGVRLQIEQHALLDPAKLVQSPMGVAAEFKPEAATPDLAAELLLRRLDGEPFLLHVGSCIPRKRIDVLLDTFAAVRSACPELWLLQIGGDWTPAQREQIGRLGIKRAIRQARGLSRATLAELYRNAEAVLVTSDAEGFGLPVIEALACAAPVAASDLPVLREVGGKAVEYVPVGDVQRWTEAVIRLMHAPETTSMRNLRQAQAQRFTWEEHGDAIADAYEGLMGLRKQPQVNYPLVLARPQAGRGNGR